MGAQDTVKIVLVGEDHLSGTLKGVAQSTSGLGQTMAGVFGGNLLTSAFQGIVSGALGAGGAIVDMSSKLEQNRIAFATMLGSAEKAGSFLKELQQFAVATPFEFPQLADAAKKMLAFGFSSQQVLPMLTAVGNATAALGSGAQGIDRITIALGQMQAKTKVQSDEMLQLVENGVPAWDMLAKKLGVDVATAMERVQKRLVDSSVFMEAFQEGVGERYGDMMAAQAQTFEGATSTIHDSLMQLGVTAFQPLFDTVSQGAIAFAAFLQTEQVTAFAEAVASGVGSAIQWFKDLFGVLTSTGGDRAGFLAALGISPDLAVQIGDYLDQAQIAIQRFIDAFGQLLNGDVAGAVDGFGAAFGRITELAADIGGRLLAWIGEQAGPILAQLQVWGQQFLDWIGPQIVPMLDQLQQLSLRLLAWAGEQVGVIAAKLVEWGTEFVKWVTPQIPPLLTALGSLLVEVAGWLIGTALPRLNEALLQWGRAFVEWVAVHVPPLLAALGELQVAVGQWIVGTALPAIGNALLTWGRAFAEWVQETAWPALSSALATLLGQITGWISSAAGSIASAAVAMGQSLMQGMINGVQGMIGQLQGAIQNAAQSALNAAKGALGIQSPSLAFQEIGVQTIAGFIAGIEDSTDDAVAAVEGLIDSVTGAAEKKATSAGAAAGKAVGKSVAKGVGSYSAPDDKFASLFPSAGKPFTGNMSALWSVMQSMPSSFWFGHLPLSAMESPFDNQAFELAHNTALGNPTDPGSGWNPDRAGNTATGLQLADGGIVTRPVRALVGEGGQPEAVAPLSDLQTMLDTAVQRAMAQGGRGWDSDTGPIQINVKNVVDAEWLAQYVAQRLGRQVTNLARSGNLGVAWPTASTAG